MPRSDKPDLEAAVVFSALYTADEHERCLPSRGGPAYPQSWRPCGLALLRDSFRLDKKNRPGEHYASER